MCPIPKISRGVGVADYRPISLLPILSKVLERLVSKHFILPFIHKYLSNPQFAYISVPGTGACCSLSLTYDRILNFLDTPSAVRILSIDFSKAFDKILHSSILKSASHFSIPKNIVHWIHSFCPSRSQCVRVNSVYSLWSHIRSGVSQSSVLGPLLFLMVVDELPCVSMNSMCI